MILNPIRLIRCALIARDLDRNLAARRAARNAGKVYVSGYVRGKV